MRNAALPAAEGLKANCPEFEALTPTGRVAAIEQRLDGMCRRCKPWNRRFRNSTARLATSKKNALIGSRRRRAKWSDNLGPDSLPSAASKTPSTTRSKGNRWPTARLVSSDLGPHVYSAFSRQALRYGPPAKYEWDLIDETCNGTDYCWACRCVVRRRISLLSEDVERHYNSFAKTLAEQLVNDGLGSSIIRRSLGGTSCLELLYLPEQIRAAPSEVRRWLVTCSPTCPRL